MRQPEPALYMEADERAVWAAAYGAAFVEEFREVHEACRRDRSSPVGPRTLVPFDRAMQVMSAACAITIADMAVLRLRQWRKDEDRFAGIYLDTYPKEWDEDE